MIRPAVKEDAKKLSELMFMIWHDMELPLVVQNDKETVLRLLEQASVESEYRNHYKHSQVFEIDGKVAAFLIAIVVLTKNNLKKIGTILNLKIHLN